MYNTTLGWFTFWATYWIVEGFLPFDEKSKTLVPSKEVVNTVCFNMFLSLPYGIGLNYLAPDIGMYIPESYIIRFLVAALIMDAWFYMIHRLLHHPKLYKWHKLHHTFYVPHPIVAVYCSPLEALLCDATAIGLAPSLLKMNGYEMQIWMICMSVHALVLHSSIGDGKDHTLHHKNLNCNFGLLSIFDKFLNTYK